MSSAVRGKGGAKPPPLERKVLVVAATVVVGAIMTILDATIVGVAIDTLGKDFDSPLATIQWVMTAYVLALAAVIPITGWAGDRFGGKRLWMFSLVLFIAGSVLCGIAWSAGVLIFFRVLQGIGGGMVAPAGMALVAQAAGPQRMGRAMSIVGVPMMLGPVVGPVLGGVLISTVSWHWIFYINLPIGAVALFMSWKFMEQTPPRHNERLDWIGMLLLPPGLVALVYGLSQLSSADGLGGTVTQVALIAGVVLLVAFTVYALRAKNPLLNLRHLKNKTFAAATTMQLLLGAPLIGSMLLLPLYYQVVRGEEPLAAGLLLVPQGIGAAAAMSLTGRLVDRGLGKGLMLLGIPVMAAGFIAYTQTGTDTSYVLMSASLLVMGLGTGCLVSPIMSAAYQAVDRRDIARATSVLNVTQRIGGAVGTALFAVVLQQNLQQAAGGTPQDVAHAFGATFWWPLLITAAVFLPALLMPMGKPAQHGPPQKQSQERAPEPASTHNE